jgi:MFS family permease
MSTTSQFRCNKRTLGGASVGVGCMGFMPLCGWLGRRYGLRRLLIAGYGATAILTVAAPAVMGIAIAGAAILVLVGFCAEIIDGANNPLRLRAAHPFERSETTAVFASDVSQFAPPAVFSMVLSLFQLLAVSVTGGIMCRAWPASAAASPGGSKDAQA